MNLCSDGHADICHEERKCPICALIAEMKRDHKDRINELQDENNELVVKVEELTEQS